MVELKIIDEKRNYSFTQDDRSGCSFKKTIISYKLILQLNFKKNFNVTYKFFHAPLKIIDYKIYIENLNKYEERTIISGPSYLRSEIYEKPNPYNPRSFKSKVKELRDLYAETKFFPDHTFIKHIKNTF